MQHTQTQEAVFDTQFGARVRHYRESRGVSQRELAQRLTSQGAAIDASGISRIEKGARTAKAFEAVALAEALDVQVKHLIHGDSALMDLNGVRRELSTYLNDMQSAVYSVAATTSDVEGMLAENPELLDGLGGDDRSPLSAPEDYPAYVADGVRRNFSSLRASGIYVNTNADQVTRLRRMLHEMVDAQLPLITGDDLRAMGVDV